MYCTFVLYVNQHFPGLPASGTPCIIRLLINGFFFEILVLKQMRKLRYFSPPSPINLLTLQMLYKGGPILKGQMFVMYGVLTTSQCIGMLVRGEMAVVLLFSSILVSKLYTWTKWPMFLKPISSLRSSRWSDFCKQREWARARFIAS
jgi:hypothetical protein